MNSILVSNVALLTLAVGTLSAAVEAAKSQQYITSGILIIIAVLAFIGYEKVPPTTPPQQYFQQPPLPPVPPAAQ